MDSKKNENLKTLTHNLTAISASLPSFPQSKNNHALFRSFQLLLRSIHLIPLEKRDCFSLIDLIMQLLHNFDRTRGKSSQGCISQLDNALSALAKFTKSKSNSSRTLRSKEKKLQQCMRSRALVPAYSLLSCKNMLNPTIDNIALLLVQIEPHDLCMLLFIQESLKSMLRSEQSTSSMELLSQAESEIGIMLKSKTKHPAATIKKIGNLLEQAMMDDLLAHTALAASAHSIKADKRKGTQKDIPLPERKESLPQTPIATDTELLEAFIIESNELILNAETALLTLETDPEDEESLNLVMRVFHTIKGSSLFLGLKIFSELCHFIESFFTYLRDRKKKYSGTYADIALHSIDMLRELLRSIQHNEAGSPICKPDNYDQLLEVLKDPDNAPSFRELKKLDGKARIGDILVAEGKIQQEALEKVIEDKGDEPVGLALLKSEAASLSDVAGALRTQRRIKEHEQLVDSTVRISTDRLDELIDMVGELVIAQSILSQDTAIKHNGHHDLSKKILRVGKIVRELQDLSMSMRMVPFKPTFQKVSRIVRDLSKRSGKEIAFFTEGDDTEIDRNMVELVKDPLVHLVRNAIDHGIEPEGQRLKKGKSPFGNITIAAYHSGGYVVVDVKDDGRGLDRKKILEKAARGQKGGNEQSMDDFDIQRIIFEPGFSTAKQVSNVSGRGVGLDVVKKNVEALRGRIDVNSEPDKGSTFSLRLPLTLAITDGMMVKVGSQRFIIPTVNIHMTFRPSPQMLFTIAGKGELVMYHKQLMPLIRLHDLFAINGALKDPTNALVVVIDEGGKKFALLVDELLGKHQVVAKSIGKGIERITGISGGAVLGDGKVGLILDTTEIAELTALEKKGEMEEAPMSEIKKEHVDLSYNSQERRET